MDTLEIPDSVPSSIQSVLDVVSTVDGLVIESVRREPRDEITVIETEAMGLKHLFEELPISLRSHLECHIDSTSSGNISVQLQLPSYKTQKNQRYIGTPPTEELAPKLLQAVADVKVYGESRGRQPNITYSVQNMVPQITIPIDSIQFSNYCRLPNFIENCTTVSVLPEGVIKVTFESVFEDSEGPSSEVWGNIRSREFLDPQLKHIAYRCSQCDSDSMILHDGGVSDPTSILHCANCEYTLSTDDQIFVDLLSDGIAVSEIQKNGPSIVESNQSVQATSAVDTNTILARNQHTNVFLEGESCVYSLYYAESYQQLHVHTGSRITTYMAGEWQKLDDSESSYTKTDPSHMYSYCKRCASRCAGELASINVRHTTDSSTRHDRSEYPYVDHGAMTREKICPSCYNELRGIVRAIERINAEQILANNI